jgi:ribonuclease BN (tRNA processing enzyme)
MKLTFAGVGSAFTTERYWQTMFLLESALGKKMLIDCGSDARFALAELGVGPDDIDAVYISHLHADHIGGLEWLAFCTYFNPNSERPTLFMNTDLMTEAWNQTLRGGLQSVQGKDCNLTDYFKCTRVLTGKKFLWEGWFFQTIQMIHIVSGFSFRNSFGLLIEDGMRPVGKSKAKRVLLTTDTQYAPNQLKDFYDMADVIVHDCETAPFHSGVHAHYDGLADLDEAVKAKMWLTHYQPDPPQHPKEDGFLGFATKGQVIEL